jgi:Tol biopolymer transport system component
MATDGSQLELIVEAGYTLLGVSPSGLRMLVSSGESLYVMGIDGSNQRLLSENYYTLGMNGAYWTSEEHKIVFIAGDGTNNAVFVGHPDTSEELRISQDDLNPIELYPSLDASGVLWSAGTCYSQGDCNREALMWSSIDGSEQRTLPDDISNPQAASSGDRIVYTTWDDQGRLRMETAAMDGSQADAVFVFGNHFMDYNWSPGATSLAIIVADRSAYSGILTGHRYYVVGMPGGDVQELPWTLGAQSNVVWSPDGLHLMLSGTDQTDASYQITIKTYDLLLEQKTDLQPWEEFSSTEYMFIPRIFWVP